MAIEAVANRLVGKETEELFKDMGKTWDFMMSDPQLRWSVMSRMGLHLHLYLGSKSCRHIQDWTGEGSDSYRFRSC